MMIHPAFAIPMILIGWFGFSARRTSIGATLSLLLIFQGVLTLAVITAFQKEHSKEAGTLVWVLVFMGLPSVMALIILSLRQYYGKKTIEWDKNEEIQR